MSLTNDQITAKNFKEFYKAIRPYLNGSFPTVIANKFDKANMYSTDEQIVGRWIDGKPLYQKTFTGTFDSNSGETIITADVNLNDNVLVDVKGYLSNSVGATYQIGYGETIFCGVILTANGVRIDTGGTNASSWRGNPYCITVQYTKTIDTAMEIGSDTDYSTTEKIIGTWMDGKPLYQKTVDVGPLPNNTSKDVAHGVSNIEYVISMSGFGKRSDGINIPLVYENADLLGNAIELYADSTNIHIDTNSDKSSYTTAYVTIQYTKTTD